MIEVLPYILIMIGWNPASPDESMALQHSLHLSQDVCERKGHEFISEKAATPSEAFPVRYKFYCIPAPTGSDYAGLFGPGQ